MRRDMVRDIEYPEAIAIWFVVASLFSVRMSITFCSSSSSIRGSVVWRHPPGSNGHPRAFATSSAEVTNDAVLFRIRWLHPVLYMSDVRPGSAITSREYAAAMDAVTIAPPLVALSAMTVPSHRSSLQNFRKHCLRSR